MRRRCALSEAEVELLSPLDLLFFEAMTGATGKAVSVCAQHLAVGGADLGTRDETQRLLPHEKASAMGFKSAAAALRGHVLEEAELEHARTGIEYAVIS